MDLPYRPAVMAIWIPSRHMTREYVERRGSAMPQSVAEGQAPVLLATLDAPEIDPTWDIASEFAVHTLPLSRPELCVSRLREQVKEPVLIITNLSGAPVLERIIAETTLFATRPIAVTIVGLPRLATRLLTAIATGEAQSGGVGQAVAFADSASNYLMSEVIVPSINKLDHPAPTLIQAARSYLPGTHSLIASGAESGVFQPPVRLTLDAFTTLAVSASAVLTDLMAEQFEAAQASPAVNRLPPWDGVELYGNARWIEFVSCNTSAVQMWSSHWRSTHYKRCQWCDQLRVRDVCAFCGYLPLIPTDDDVLADAFSPTQGGHQ